MTRRGEGQKRGSAEAQRRRRDTIRVALPLPRTSSAPGTWPPARLHWSQPPRPSPPCLPGARTGAGASSPAGESGRHHAASDLVREPGPTPTREQAGAREGVRGPSGKDSAGCGSVGVGTPRKGRRGGLEERRSASGPRAWSKLRSHFQPPPSPAHLSVLP